MLKHSPYSHSPFVYSLCIFNLFPSHPFYLFVLSSFFSPFTFISFIPAIISFLVFFTHLFNCVSYCHSSSHILAVPLVSTS
jgi:hypothetical protein